MNRQTNIILDPSSHIDSVQAFMRASGIPGGSPRLGLLEKLVEAFSQFPYENISKIIKLSKHLDEACPVRLPEEVVEDHLRAGLGGTCFSMTFTLQTILTHNGFTCYPVMAHMRAGRNIHCALVTLVGESKHLIDPGYLLGSPVELDHRRPVSFDNEFTRVELFFQPGDGAYHLYTITGQERKWRYCFADHPTTPQEFLSYWQDSFHKNAMHGICLNRVTPQGLVYVRKRFMRQITPQGKRNVNIKSNYHAAILENFGIRQELVEQALAALGANMAWEREKGLFPPKGRRYETIGS
jgi:arylamine N-acetyltransferase